MCAADKAEVVQRLLRQNPGCSVMCGDSLSDLQALLAVDFGIVIGSSSSLRRVMNAAGISRQPLSQGLLLASHRNSAGFKCTDEQQSPRSQSAITSTVDQSKGDTRNNIMWPCSARSYVPDGVPSAAVRRDVVGPRGTLLHVEDWGEIDAFLFPKSS